MHNQPKWLLDVKLSLTLSSLQALSFLKVYVAHERAYIEISMGKYS